MSKKESREDLAHFGGQPAFENPLHVGCPNVGDRERFMRRVESAFDRRWFTNNGPLVMELESRLARYLDVRHCVLACNATIGLQMAVRALGLKGEVILPSFTFVATAHALAWQGLIPVFCDVDPHTHNINPREIEHLITPRTSGIVGVHVWGRPCDVDAIELIAERNKLKVLYDAAHAFGCSRGPRMVGGFGDAEVFSFHATKFFNTFEGGAITTNDERLADELRLIRNFGFVGQDQVDALGINGKMSEISAAMGLTLLESLDELLEVNHRNHEAYRRGLADIPGLTLVDFNDADRNNHQYVVVDVDPEVFGLDRDGLQQLLREENILARRYFYPACHRSQPYVGTETAQRRPLPETERLASRLMTLPTGSAVGAKEISLICRIARLARSATAR